MEDYRIHTPEQVDISYTVAGLGTRFMAMMIDGLIQSVLWLILFLSMMGLNDFSERFREWYLAFVILASAIILYGYFLIFELLLKGRTPGKAAMKIRVVRMDGQAADPSGLALRNLVRLIDSLPVFYGVGVVAMFVNRDCRRIGDLAGGTIVVLEQKRADLSTILSSQGVADNPALKNDEYAMIRDFLARRDSLTPQARAKLAEDIAGILYERFRVPPENRFNAEAFLENLLNTKPL